MIVFFCHVIGGIRFDSLQTPLHVTLIHEPISLHDTCVLAGISDTFLLGQWRMQMSQNWLVVPGLGSNDVKLYHLLI